MNVLRARSVSRFALLLAALAVVGTLADLHDHDLLPAEAGQAAALPAFEAAHAQPDGSLHVEAARRVQPSACLGCQLRTSPRVGSAIGCESGSLQPDLALDPIDVGRPTSAGIGQLPSPRAPPRV